MPIEVSEDITYDELIEIISSRFGLNCNIEYLSITNMLSFDEKQKASLSKIRDDRDLRLFG